MGHRKTWIRDGLLSAGFILLLLLGLVLFAVLAFAVRPLLVVAAIVVLVGGAVLARFSPRFRDWFEASGERQISHKGLRLATDIAVHPNHSWARFGPAGVAVGADDFVQATLGPVEAVDLPPVGAQIEPGDRLFSLRRGNRSVDIRSPIAGSVATRNDALVERPQLVNEEPFARGWAVRLRTSNGGEGRLRLLRGRQARGWFRQEIDRLIGTVLARDPALSTLPDGGVLVGELYRHIDDRAWKSLTETFFGAEPKADA